jgi:O-antigen/teichoic acid export membrane protein
MTSKIQSLAKSLTFDRLFFNSALIFFFVMAGNFFNYLFQIAMSRSLSVSNYGTLNALLSLLVITSIPSGALTAFSAKNISNNLAVGDITKARKFIKYTILKTFLYDCLFLVIFIICIPFLMKFMKIDSYFYYIITGLAIFLIFPFSLLLGSLQGSRMYLSLGLFSALSSIIKFILAIALVYAGLKVAGALFSVAVSPLLIIAAAAVVLFLYLKHRQGIVEEEYKVKDKTEGNVLKTGRFYFLSLFFMLLFYTLFTNIDLIIVKHFFTNHEVGIYSVADILGKIILYFPSAIVLVMFPEVSHAHATNNKTKNILLKSITITFVLCSFLEIFYILFPDKIISLLMGVKYISSAPLLTLYGLSMFPFAFINIFINYFMAVNNSKILIPMFLFSLLEILLFYLLHYSLTEIILTVMITGWAVMLVFSIYAFHEELYLLLKRLLYIIQNIMPVNSN